MERVRVIHGDWTRCLNHHYGGDSTAVFLDPPYDGYESIYGADEPVSVAVAQWARENANLKIALCGHIGDYEMDGWEVYQWERAVNTYGGTGTKASECIWFSPACAESMGQRVLL
jgi:16S rRNA G966 N2-methylase RsmD